MPSPKPAFLVISLPAVNIRLMIYHKSEKMLVTKQKSVRVMKLENYGSSLHPLYTVFEEFDLEEEVNRKIEAA